MNVFFVDEDPYNAAYALCDSHVVKMILESAQLLSTSHRVLDGTQYVAQQNNRKIKRWLLEDIREDIMYKATHVNHGSAIWARTSVENYLWLVDHLEGLLDEYKRRYNKIHKVANNFFYLQSPPYKLESWDFTIPPSMMDEQYIISDDPVINYRNYYANGKKHLHKWTNSQKPEWLEGFIK